jgi:hypothetical protein
MDTNCCSLQVLQLYCVQNCCSNIRVVSLLQMDHWKMHRKTVWVLNMSLRLVLFLYTMEFLEQEFSFANSDHGPPL